MPLPWSFGRLESVLAVVHRIADDKRTAFQSRLKNFQRLGLFPDQETIKGQPTQYEAHHILRMGLAIELTQIGLPPDRIVSTIHSVQLMIAAIAADASESLMAENGMDLEVASKNGHFLFFEPHALASMSKNEMRYSFIPLFDHDLNKLAGLGGGVISRFAGVNLTLLIRILFMTEKDPLPALRDLFQWAEPFRLEAIEKGIYGNS